MKKARRFFDEPSCVLAWCPVLVALCVWGCEKAVVDETPPVRPVRFFQVGASTGRELRTYPGIVEASQEVDLAFRVSGPLVELNATEGNRVEKGATLAQIDPRDYENRLAQTTSSLESAEAELKAMRAGARPEDLREMEAAVASAQSLVTQAEADFNRAERLLAENAVAQRTYDTARTNRDQAKAALQQAQAELEKGRSGARPEDIEATEANIRRMQSQKKEAEDALSDTKLLAPFTGLVAKRFVDNHQTVPAGQPVVKLQNKETVDVVIQIPEHDLPKSPKRAEDVVDLSNVRVVFDNYPGQQFPVALKEFQTQADRDTQTYELRLSVDPPDNVVIAPGMTASVQVVPRGESSEAGVLTVPSEAVFQTPEGQAAVWVIDPAAKRVNKREVEVGSIRGARVEVTQGLSAGETIAATGVHYLREGMEVREMTGGGDAQ
ncbi:MAG TPA: efflux RND transporter periplasmic adaptor subunit [Candidatus Hydrogenedentes bacterium]|nr:efflux RND transporter periplasmic adaptor subunit [Candidatus Hydrogenedentota bacterium]HQE83942.1 efflux RND transporter periplasmic adaptor subunit [Candidatus Hydrogenedentota bacterium]HQH53036.1 efflux RND transporter periplasmic adaptor subunit [Candidatus Hydrogenedentota bacterium]HQM48444.1 efflux RND transporter periplasmic adaptor subunit [Candidatus Hydrogenedentota bacterium]